MAIYRKLTHKFITAHQSNLLRLEGEVNEKRLRVCYARVAPRLRLSARMPSPDALAGADEVTKLITLRGFLEGDRVIIEPADDASARAIQEWTEEHVSHG